MNGNGKLPLDMNSIQRLSNFGQYLREQDVTLEEVFALFGYKDGQATKVVSEVNAWDFIPGHREQGHETAVVVSKNKVGRPKGSKTRHHRRKASKSIKRGAIKLENGDVQVGKQTQHNLARQYHSRLQDPKTGTIILGDGTAVTFREHGECQACIDLFGASLEYINLRRHWQKHITEGTHIVLVNKQTKRARLVSKELVSQLLAEGIYGEPEREPTPASTSS